jgi:hypothetical protein
MKHVRDAHGKIFKAADRCFEGKRIQASPNDSKDHWDSQMGMVEHAVSACSTPPSGTYLPTDSGSNL